MSGRVLTLSDLTKSLLLFNMVGKPWTEHSAFSGPSSCRLEEPEQLIRLFPSFSMSSTHFKLELISTPCSSESIAIGDPSTFSLSCNISTSLGQRPDKSATTLSIAEDSDGVGMEASAVKSLSCCFFCCELNLCEGRRTTLFITFFTTFFFLGTLRETLSGATLAQSLSKSASVGDLFTSLFSTD
ncbi:LOW QUALITY PROTEIN: hypothetical protein PanWU01x14_154590 [Parasponia andersonii]|uniref:Uncharacterized protein n=1 Tax=Parasponia andersonii TaxID=3476 RepID=A0A2P5CGH5_PARAD|nr:LOW QUALITY PROTEIN: hypothetical protein PanWU01x14_154590 [Parasponia andersonii]